MHEGMNPSQKRVEAYATKGLSWGSGRPARVPTHIGRVGRVRHLVPYRPFLLSSPMLPPLSLQLVLSALALAWVDKPVRKGMGSSLRELAAGEFWVWPGLPRSVPVFGSPRPRASTPGFLECPLPPLSSSP